MPRLRIVERARLGRRGAMHPYNPRPRRTLPTSGSSSLSRLARWSRSPAPGPVAPAWRTPRWRPAASAPGRPTDSFPPTSHAVRRAPAAAARPSRHERRPSRRRWATIRHRLHRHCHRACHRPAGPRPARPRHRPRPRTGSHCARSDRRHPSPRHHRRRHVFERARPAKAVALHAHHTPHSDVERLRHALARARRRAPPTPARSVSTRRWTVESSSRQPLRRVTDCRRRRSERRRCAVVRGRFEVPLSLARHARCSSRRRRRRSRASRHRHRRHHRQTQPRHRHRHRRRQRRRRRHHRHHRHRRSASARCHRRHRHRRLPRRRHRAPAAGARSAPQAQAPEDWAGPAGPAGRADPAPAPAQAPAAERADRVRAAAAEVAGSGRMPRPVSTAPAPQPR